MSLRRSIFFFTVVRLTFAVMRGWRQDLAGFRICDHDRVSDFQLGEYGGEFVRISISQSGVTLKVSGRCWTVINPRRQRFGHRLELGVRHNLPLVRHQFVAGKMVQANTPGARKWTKII